MLRALSDAIIAKGVLIPFTDHHKGCRAWTENYRDALKVLADILGLNMSIEICGGSVWVKSNI